jgi:hypothetical protein
MCHGLIHHGHFLKGSKEPEPAHAVLSCVALAVASVFLAQRLNMLAATMGCEKLSLQIWTSSNSRACGRCQSPMREKHPSPDARGPALRVRTGHPDHAAPAFPDNWLQIGAVPAVPNPDRCG